MAALAGLVIAARIGSGDPQAGSQFTLASVTAVVVGGPSIFGGRGTVVGSVLGVEYGEQADWLQPSLHSGAKALALVDEDRGDGECLGSRPCGWCILAGLDGHALVFQRRARLGLWTRHVREDQRLGLIEYVGQLPILNQSTRALTAGTGATDSTRDLLTSKGPIGCGDGRPNLRSFLASRQHSPARVGCCRRRSASRRSAASIDRSVMIQFERKDLARSLLAFLG